MRFFVRIYDYFQGHKTLLWTSLGVLTVLFVACILRIRYSEDVEDFLPLSGNEREALSVYESISGADKLYFLFSNPDDVDKTVEAIEYFSDEVRNKDHEHWCDAFTAQFDMDLIQSVTDFVYDNMPYFLTDEDYERIDSLLAIPGYIEARLQRDRQMLMFPTGSVATSSVINDPLGLYGPVLDDLKRSGMDLDFEMYDGYIFTPDMSRAVAMMDSPFGNSETEKNTKMLKMLKEAGESMTEHYPGVRVDIIGGPEIAVGNADRIKKDTILAVSLSVALIILLLVTSFNSLRNILLILLSIAWGWIFALGGMALFLNNVSIIVIGISSVILGIALNYPLHLVAHLGHHPDIKGALKDLVGPLVIGNITTVGAFMALIPLQSTALRDLGIFSSLLLVGTIVFVLVYLPHMVKVTPGKTFEVKWLMKVANLSPDKNKWVVMGVVVLTVVFYFLKSGMNFNSNVANLNYMTDSQREDMAYFMGLMEKHASKTSQTVYALSRGEDYDAALVENAARVQVIDSLVDAGMVNGYNGVQRYLVSQHEQMERLDRWNLFVNRHGSFILNNLRPAAQQLGFADDAFEQFESSLSGLSQLEPRDIEYFAPLTSMVLSQNVTRLEQTGKSYIVNVLDVDNDKVDAVKARLDHSFDVVSMNSALCNTLSRDFDYIGLACSLIVFFFLWFSFGRLELAIISFLPMAVSWVWILGLMGLMGMQFNIVNIILATFIFGQGDDYTIFMTEGCQYEYRLRRPILASYKSSILQSALIMFVGMGTLIVARHPAMHSLATVTIIGMATVVFMSYLIPPLCFRYLTTSRGKVRRYPITLRRLIFGVPKDPVAQVRGRYIYKGKQMFIGVYRSLRHNAHHILSLDIPEGESYEYRDKGYGECALLIALTHPKARIVAHIEDEERRRVAQVCAEDFLDNIEFKE